MSVVLPIGFAPQHVEPADEVNRGVDQFHSRLLQGHEQIDVLSVVAKDLGLKASPFKVSDGQHACGKDIQKQAYIE
jgi:hypothetical protein